MKIKSENWMKIILTNVNCRYFGEKAVATKFGLCPKK